MTVGAQGTASNSTDDENGGGRRVMLANGDKFEGSPQFPKIYKRDINIEIVDLGGAHLRVKASLVDRGHCFDAELLVDIQSGRIDEVSASMAKRPYDSMCPRALCNVAKLKGQIIGPGISKRIVELLGRSQGCVHLVELFHAAVGFAANTALDRRSGYIWDIDNESEETRRQKWLPILKDSCQVFRVETEAKEKS